MPPHVHRTDISLSFVTLVSAAPLGASFVRKRRTPLTSGKQPRPFCVGDGRCRGSIMCDSGNALDDEAIHEIRKYLDSPRTPKEGPLAFDTLKRLGRDDLMSAILDAGGSAVVAEEMRLDQSLFIPPLTAPKSTMLADFGRPQDGASVKIGNALEERLESIEQVQSGETAASRGDPYRTYRQGDAVLSGEELQEMNESFTPPIVDEPTPFDERLTLPASLRLGMFALVISSAIGFGRASDGVIDVPVQKAFQSISCGLGVAHIVLAAYVGFSMAPSMGRSPFIWFTKILLSGPIGVQYLKAAGPLNSDEK